MNDRAVPVRLERGKPACSSGVSDVREKGVLTPEEDRSMLFGTPIALPSAQDLC